jgi:hypothetical protein
MASLKGVSSAATTGYLGGLLDHLISGSSTGEKHLRWPPDVFAICAYLLKLTGAYVEVLREWPPQQPPTRVHPPDVSWIDWVQEVGRAWRAVAANRRPVPSVVVDLWRTVARARGLRIEQVSANRPVVSALLHLVAISDEASAGAGIPQSASRDAFRARALQLLAGINTQGESTLSPLVSRAELRVLPKQHTPRGGLTLRSLTHHLALHIGSEVTPFWYTVPQPTVNHSMNLLVAPWPLKLRPSQFQPAKGTLHDMPPRFGFVEFRLDENPQRVAEWTAALIKEATTVAGRVDGVVFPEGALSAPEYEQVRSVVLENGAFLIAGVLRASRKKNGAAENLVMLDAINSGLPMNVEQRKHHRWRLDRGQIEMYGLGGTLDPTRDWWEHIVMGRREVHFVSLNEQLSLCCLVCEDLARQDPVAELVRSVGPNLVVALLMDAPQLGVRWPARYATVLADDPGSSVLTLTSAGMVDLTRPPRSAKPSRSIGLWKDARSDFVELELPQGAAGLLLSLCTEAVEEWTADGRSDQGVTGYPRLGGIHAIWVKEESANSLKLGRFSTQRKAPVSRSRSHPPKRARR